MSPRIRGRRVAAPSPALPDPAEPQKQSVDPRRAMLLEEARKSVEQQSKDLDSLRGRATALITLSVAVATFLVGMAVNKKIDVPCWGVLGAGLLVVAVLAAQVTLWPMKFTFNLNVDKIDDAFYNDRSADDMARDNAFGLRDAAAENQTKINLLMNLYLFALGAMVVGTALLASSLMWR